MGEDEECAAGRTKFARRAPPSPGRQVAPSPEAHFWRSWRAVGARSLLGASPRRPLALVCRRGSDGVLLSGGT